MFTIQICMLLMLHPSNCVMIAVIMVAAASVVLLPIGGSSNKQTIQKISLGNLRWSLSYPPTTAPSGNYLTDSSRWDNNYSSDLTHRNNQHNSDKNKTGTGSLNAGNDVYGLPGQGEELSSSADHIADNHNLTKLSTLLTLLLLQLFLHLRHAISLQFD
ncbi:hypothetical protein FF38_13249 [Lucilia cuprina]|uniref:Uncharacterized protein n=1 Tax=Lucilia cuprina TaxID=7375 RepID=A0A0L0CLX8_LUCCU|nr:hypothetical protein FF38_13249 [Lucilia cuprina]